MDSIEKIEKAKSPEIISLIYSLMAEITELDSKKEFSHVHDRKLDEIIKAFKTMQDSSHKDCSNYISTLIECYESKRSVLKVLRGQNELAAKIELAKKKAVSERYEKIKKNTKEPENPNRFELIDVDANEETLKTLSSIIEEVDALKEELGEGSEMSINIDQEYFAGQPKQPAFIVNLLKDLNEIKIAITLIQNQEELYQNKKVLIEQESKIKAKIEKIRKDFHKLQKLIKEKKIPLKIKK